MVGAAAPALGVGSKAATKVLGKVLGKAGMSEAMAAGTATVAGMAGEGGAIGSIMGGVGDLAAQGYDIHTGKQSAINWKQTGVSTLAGGLTGFVMGGAFGAFSQTSAGKAFGKWMQEPTKLDMKAAEMVKSFAGNNRGSVNLGAAKGGSGSPQNKTSLWGQEKYVTKKGLNTVKQHLTGFFADEFNDVMINRLETAYNNNTKISGADLDFYAHEIYESCMMKGGMGYNDAHEAAKAYYNATEFNFYHPEVIKQNPKLFNNAWFNFWGIERS